MIATTEALDALKSIGLNLYERKIFVALLAKGIASAAEVSEIASVPRSRSYDVLESLAEKGFVLVQPSKPIKYVALKPKEALERTKENLRKEHETMIDRIDRLKASPILGELESIHKKGLNLIKTTEMTGTLKGSSNINRHFASVIRNAKKSIDILTSSEGLDELYSSHFKSLKKLKKKGITIRIAAPTKNSNILKTMNEVGQIKNIENSVGRICTIDNESMLIGLTDDDEHETQHIAFWAHSPYAVRNSMSTFFESIWKSK